MDDFLVVSVHLIIIVVDMAATTHFCIRAFPTSCWTNVGEATDVNGRERQVQSVSGSSVALLLHQGGFRRTGPMCRCRRRHLCGCISRPKSCEPIHPIPSAGRQTNYSIEIRAGGHRVGDLIIVLDSDGYFSSQPSAESYIFAIPYDSFHHPATLIHGTNNVVAVSWHGFRRRLFLCGLL